MNGREAREVVELIRRMGPAVLSTTPTSPNMRRAVGALVANTEIMLSRVWFTQAFIFCLDLARREGATLATMGRVRKAALAETPVGLPAIAAQQAVIRLSLSAEARIIITMDFKSRDDVQSVFTEMQTAFLQAAEVASDALDAAGYMTITGLQASVVKYLTDQGRRLPRVIPYKNVAAIPSLVMSQSRYGDASRSDELRLENKVIHPAFMPMEGRMLAV